MENLIKRADAIDAVAKLNRYDVDERNRLRAYTPFHGTEAQTFIDVVDLYQALEALPSADAVQGEWEEYTDCEGKTRTITCSECGWEEHSWIDTNYCPNCGAKMKGGAE